MSDHKDAEPLTGMGRGRPGIMTQILLLVTFAVMATALALIAISLRGPPPVPAPTKAEEIVHALMEGRAMPSAGRAMRVRDLAARPAIDTGMRDDAGVARAVWRMLPPGSVMPHIYVDGPPPTAGPAFSADEIRGDFVVHWQTGTTWRVIRANGAAVRWQWWITTSAAVLTALALVIILAAVYARSVTLPLRRLAEAAENGTIGLVESAPPGGDGAASIRSALEIEAVERALHRAVTRNRQSYDAQIHMLAAIAHDLGTPLMRLAFRIEGLSPDLRDAAGRDIEMMRRLIADSLSLARGQLVQTAPVDLADLAVRLAECSATPAAPVKVGACDAAVVEGEPVALQRMVQNIIDNAQRYAGGCTLAVERRNGFAVVRIEDDGPGIAPDLLPMITDPFVRGDPSRSEQHGGNGLGLAIAQRIAQRHGGHMQLANRGGSGGEGGLRVTIHLPLR